ncbi:lipopolysaccharide biosynthesis protein [Mycolicibacterium sp.]|uniref:lipopolysaccharide biosynthesis protein n=1 Tax=Mycolicibacterium sp. TaxID=2320850 RepID=UPI003D111E3B
MTLTGWRGARLGDVEAQPAQHNLRINTFSLIFSNLLTGVLGLAFWGAAARLYPTEAVGVGAAVLSSGILLSTLSMLSIDTLYERFLPIAGFRAGPLLIRGFSIVSATALIAGVGLVWLGPRESLFQNTWQMATYPVLVVLLALYTILDKTTAGLGVARWAAAKNSIHSVVKLVVLLGFAFTASAESIILSWVGTGAAAVLVLVLAIRRRLRTDPQFQVPPTLPPDREIWRYFGSSFGLTATWAIGPLIVPLIVLSKFGPAANAHFAVTWAIVNAFYSTVHLIVSPYVAEVAAHPDKVGALTRRMVATMAVVNVAASLGLLIIGPFVLGLVGGDYRTEGQGLLYLAAVFVPLSAVASVYEGFARVRRKLGAVMAVRCVVTTIVIGGSLVGTGMFGMVGVGWAYLVAEALGAVILLVPVCRWVRRFNTDPDWLIRTAEAEPGRSAL